ncbi:MAG: ATP-binding protein [Lachnospiraceae bacterium]
MQIQIVIILLLVCILPLSLLSLRLLHSYRETEKEERHAAVLELCRDLGTRVQRTSYVSTASQPELSAAIDMAAQIYEGRVLVINSELLVVKDTYGGHEEGKTMISEEVVSALRGKESVYRNDTNQTVEVIYPIRDTQTETVMGAIIFLYSVETEEVQTEAMGRNAMLFSMVLIVIVIVVAMVYSARLVYPLKQLALDMQKSADGYWEENLKVKGCFEVESIAESINSMLADMRDTEKRRQEFVSNVSHELKTPLTSMKVLADSLLSQQNAPPELYQEFLLDINNEIDRETKIITDLLNLVKLDRKEGDMQIAQVSINELLEIVLRRLRPIAKQRNIEMIFESYRNVLAEVDEVKMSLVFTNLIENAIKYNRDGGMVKVSLNADHKYFYVKVEDNGIGIPEDAKKYIFDRFYRVDKARSRETGGTGLGLAITKSAVMMHKGSIKVSGKEGEGSVFVVRIPLSFIPDYPTA